MIASDQSQIEKYIGQERYKEDGGREPEQHYAIIEWLEETKNTSEKLRHVLNLTKFYGIPFLYECRVLFSRMTVSDYESLAPELHKLAAYAKSLLGDDIPKELQFLFSTKQQTSSKIVYPPYKFSEPERKFIDYWKSIRRGVAKIESLSFTNKVSYEKAVNDFLEKEIKDDAQFTTFENRVIDVYLEKVYEHQNTANSVMVPQEAQKTPMGRPNTAMEVEGEQTDYGIPLISRADLSSATGENWRPITADYANPNKMPDTRPLNTPAGLKHEPMRQPNFQTQNRKVPQQNPFPGPQTNPQPQEQRPRTNQGKGPEQANNQLPICCRRSFYKNEVLDQSESLTLEFKNYRYPWNDELRETLTKVIVGFLNRSGGILLIGVAEDNDTKKPTVVGGMYNEATKQLIQFEFTKLIKKIYPDIISNAKVDIQFVPLRSHQSEQYIAGMYLIRVIIEYGERDRVYFFTKGTQGVGGGTQDVFVFRTQKEVIYRNTKAALDEQLSRARKPLEIPPRLHEGYCFKPEIGRPIYGDPANTPTRIRETEFNRPQENFQKNGFAPRGGFEKAEKVKPESGSNWDHPNNYRQQPQRGGVDPQGRPGSGFDVQHTGQQQRPNSRQNEAQRRPTQKPQPSYKQTPSNMSFIYIIAIKLPSKNEESYVRKLLEGIQYASPVYTASKTIAAIEIPKSADQQLKSNFMQLQKAYPQLRSITLITPTVCLEFRGDKAQESFATAAKALDKRVAYQIDYKSQLLKFKAITDAINAFLRLVNAGLFPRFSNRE